MNLNAIPATEITGASLPCRILGFEAADGASNMALDHALLDAVDDDPASAVLRTYAWSEPTLSLGYFQSIADVDRDEAFRGLAVVRRPSGGGALLHHHELTYALIMPRSHPLAKRPSDLYRAVHSAIATLLTDITGHTASRRGANAPLSKRPFLCFADHDPEDILIDGTKVVGSAQRRRPRAALQHGSILLRSSPYASQLLGIEDKTGLSLQIESLSERLLSDLPRVLELQAQASEVQSAERASARVIRVGTYSAASWTSRR